MNEDKFVENSSFIAGQETKNLASIDSMEEFFNKDGQEEIGEQPSNQEEIGEQPSNQEEELNLARERKKQECITGKYSRPQCSFQSPNQFQTQERIADGLSMGDANQRDAHAGVSEIFNRHNHPFKLRLKKETVITGSNLNLSPSEEWKLKKKRKEKNRLSLAASNAINSGWKIRQQLHAIKRSSTGNVNEFYLQTVESGVVEDVKALFDCCKSDHSFNFDRDYIDHRDIDALRIAILNKNLKMCNFLLKHEVDLRHNLLFAVEEQFYDGIQAILSYNPSTDLCVKHHNYYFNVGITPLILAAHKNDYKMLKILYSYGHRLRETMNWWEGVHYAFESANERAIICTAKASPAYITLYCEENKINPMSFCLSLIKDFRSDGDIEQEIVDFYKNLENQIEDLMCRLLDQLQSSEELAHLYEYEFSAYWNPHSALESFGDGATPLTLAQSRLDLLDKAGEQRLMKFVTHQNSQLALSYVRYRYTTFLRSRKQIKRVLYIISLSLLFPIWCLFYLIAPHTKLGGIITLPNISYFCHLASDVIFILLLIVNVVTKSPDLEYLGASPTVVEWLILLWILGKWVQEVRQLQNQGFRKYTKDWWNFIDIFQLTLFATAIGLRIWDFFAYINVPIRTRRTNWTIFECRLIATGFLAWGYIFVFLRILSLIRTNRILGPLQVSVAKMLLKVAQFFTTFGLILFSFALALTELFWYYGTEPGYLVICIGGRNGTKCKNTFTSIGTSLETLFWSIFGYFNLEEIPNAPQLRFVYGVGLSLLCVFHVVAIIILINTLIAMMAQSFEEISQNRDMEWKFHRTVVWIHFVRREATRPPPMNLLPNPHAIYKQMKRLKNWFFYSVLRRKNERAEREKRIRMGQLVFGTRYHLGVPAQQLRDLELAAFQEKEILKKHLSLKVSFLLLNRFKFSELLRKKT